MLGLWLRVTPLSQLLDAYIEAFQATGSGFRGFRVEFGLLCFGVLSLGVTG